MRTSPQDNPAGSMAASSTHDQVTVAGCLTGSDSADLESIGKAFSPAHAQSTRRALAILAGIDPERPLADMTRADIEAAVVAQYAGVAHSPSLVAVVTLDDAGGVAQRPNMPGTIDQWPNWRLGLPVTVDALLGAPLAGQIAHLMTDAGR
jgi:4-alpha-glucanotransferase